MSQLLYVYGIVSSNHVATQTNVITSGSLAALVETVSTEDFGEAALAENIKNMEWVSQKAVHHQEVLNAAVDQSSVIPLKFGSVFSSEENVKVMLADKTEHFSSLLARLDGKQEWGLKLFYQPSSLEGWLNQNESELKSINEQIEELSSGAAFLLKKKKEQLVKEKVKKEVNTYRKRAFDIAKGLSEELLQNKEMDSKLSGNSDVNLLNVALLINPEQQEGLREQLISLTDSSGAAKGLYYDLTGPWPAYNFVNL